MTESAYKALCECRDKFRAITEEIQAALPCLQKLQQSLVDGRKGPRYKVETPVVYNTALDELGPSSDIRLILVGDNPGRREQAAENRRYLVGPSGKIAENFFRKEAVLCLDFRKNVLILNKTPVHTPRTADLRELCGMGGETTRRVIETSQESMARLLADFYRALRVPVWITGYSEMRRHGVFERYTDELEAATRRGGLDRESVYLYRHFSMNQFTIDLRQKTPPGVPIAQTLPAIGAAYREKILF
ncbi:MAG: uracil-DNA glycosylase family protein [Spirochaetaceae bacterium]|nr:uracil-DNA glycosylase family protein [Spirochaetaceae bacterium]